MESLRQSGMNIPNELLENFSSLQRVCYSGHKRKHCLNYQAVVAPDGTKHFFIAAASDIKCLKGICVSFYGPIEGRRHDSTLLRESKLLDHIRGHAFLSQLGILIYGDLAYGLNDFIMAPFAGAFLTEAQKNLTMRCVRVAVEWMFNIVNKQRAFVDWSKKHKIMLSPVASHVKVAMLLSNCLTCIRATNQISEYFGCAPPTPQEYLSR